MISRSWSVLAVWTLGRGLPEVEAISGAIPLPPSLPYSHLYRSPTLRHLFHSLAAGPSILCSFYACVSTCPEWPSSCERRTLENRTHTEVLAYRRPLLSPPHPSATVFSRGSCQPPAIDMGCCLLVSGTDFGPNQLCVMHPSSDRTAQWDLLQIHILYFTIRVKKVIV